MFALGVIPARGGSKGLPGKNIRPLGNLPLIAWTIQAAKKSSLLAKTIVSTDDPSISAIAKNAGGEVPFLRPDHLATDFSDLVGVLQHAVVWCESESRKKIDIVVALQPTSPFRRSDEIDGSIRLISENGGESSQTVMEDHHHPFHRFYLTGKDKLEPWNEHMKGSPTRRQAWPTIYRYTGSVYAVRRDILMNNGVIVGEDHRGLVVEDSLSIDIDNEWDFKVAEWIVRDGLHLR